MRRFRAVFLLLVLAGAPAATAAQVPSGAQLPVSPAVQARGGTGAALPGSLDAVSENPALLATVTTPALSVSFLRVAQVDLESFLASAAISVRRRAWFGVSVFESRISDIVEDPDIDESELAVGDFGVRAAAALSFGSGHAQAGAALTRSWSTVLATQGSATFLDLGASYAVSSRLLVGVALRRLGAGQRWKTSTGERFAVGIVPAARLAAAVEVARTRTLAVTLLNDFECTPRLERVAAGWGVEIGLLGAVRLRGGLQRQGDAPTSWAGGIGLSLRGMDLDLVYDELAVIGPRVGVGLELTRHRQAPPP